MGFREFVALIAGLMALNALAIDSMLPALPQIGAALGVVHENDRQWIITAYLLGFGVAQIFWGSLSDRFGRRPILLGCLVFYITFSALAAFTTSFAMMLAVRALQGVAASASRVLTVSIVRDCYSGRQMARVMSLAFIVFLAVPIMAPSLGQLVLLFAPWHWVFGILGIYGCIILVWSALRLPETLHPEYRMPITLDRLSTAWRLVLTDRMSLGYTLAQGLVMGSLFGFISSAQQIFFDVFDMPTWFPLIFAGIASAMGVASFINSRIVERLGTRRVSHSALIGFTAIAGIHVLIALWGLETIWTFAILQALMMSCFGLASSNFGSMAMTPLGAVAGTAASIQGFITTVAGALLGFAIGQQFDGTTVPVTSGYFALGLGALAVVLWAEKGKLFQPHESEQNNQDEMLVH